jgi:membrane fusion protein
MKNNLQIRDGAFDQVLHITSKGFNWFIYIIAFLVIFSIYYLTINTYSRNAKANGILTTNKGSIKVVANDPGIIEYQYVSLGDQVSKGDVLYTINTERHGNQLIDLDGKIIESLNESVKNINSQIDSSNSLDLIEKGMLNKQVEQKKNQIKFVIKQKELISWRITNLQKYSASFEALFKEEHVTEHKYYQTLNEILDTQIQEEELDLKIHSLNNEILELENRLETLPLQAKLKIKSSQELLTNLENQIIETSSRRSYSIVSPVDGVVTSLFTKEKEFIQPGKTALTILPLNSKYQVDLYIDTKSIGFIEQGDEVLLRYSAFPYEHFGLYKGLVANISKVISQPEDVENVIQLESASYKVTVDLEVQKINAFKKEYDLYSGMSVEATIKLEERTLLEWLFSPILGLKGSI